MKKKQEEIKLIYKPVEVKQEDADRKLERAFDVLFNEVAKVLEKNG